MEQYRLEDSEPEIQLEAAWQNALARIKGEVQTGVFERFIKPLSPVSYRAGVVRLSAPGRFVQEWVRERFLALIQTNLSDEIGATVSVEVLAKPRDKSEASKFLPEPAPAVVTSSGQGKFEPNPKYTFEKFVKGQSNRLAFAGAKAVSDSPGTEYNPLFIYGDSGLGKTHLLHAIANQILNLNPKANILYVTAQQFAEEFVQALQTGQMDSFRRLYRNVSIWLVDDIQFIANKDKTQEEIFHTFNFLHSTNKQIVLTSDRVPKDLFLMDDRLRSRFESGLVADIQLPDTETRCAIVLSKIQETGVRVEPEVAMILAQSIPGNVRALEGAIKKLVMLAGVENVEITPEFCSSMVEKYYPLVYTKPGFKQIVELVSQNFQVDITEICGSSRKAPIVQARHVAIYLTRRITGDSWKHIGSKFGDRDHTSIMHGYQRVDEQMHMDRELMLRVKQLMKNLSSSQ
jgi:chromosomal replication initiator protein